MGPRRSRRRGAVKGRSSSSLPSRDSEGQGNRSSKLTPGPRHPPFKRTRKELQVKDSPGRDGFSSSESIDEEDPAPRPGPSRQPARKVTKRPSSTRGSREDEGRSRIPRHAPIKRPRKGILELSSSSSDELSADSSEEIDYPGPRHPPIKRPRKELVEQAQSSSDEPSADFSEGMGYPGPRHPPIKRPRKGIVEQARSSSAVSSESSEEEEDRSWPRHAPVKRLRKEILEQGPSMPGPSNEGIRSAKKKISRPKWKYGATPRHPQKAPTQRTYERVLHNPELVSSADDGDSDDGEEEMMNVAELFNRSIGPLPPHIRSLIAEGPQQNDNLNRRAAKALARELNDIHQLKLGLAGYMKAEFELEFQRAALTKLHDAYRARYGEAAAAELKLDSVIRPGSSSRVTRVSAQR